MKRIIILTLMLFPFLASAGPPPDSYQKQVPFLLFCHKSENLIIGAIQKSFGEYIFATGDVMDGRMKMFFFKDPDDKSFTIGATMGDETCVIFSGDNFEHFDKPPYIMKEGDEKT